MSDDNCVVDIRARWMDTEVQSGIINGAQEQNVFEGKCENFSEEVSEIRR